MNRVRELRKALGRDYVFRRYVSEREVRSLQKQIPKYFAETVVASLTAGCVKIEAVLFRGSCGLVLGYDVFVKDDSNAAEWIIFDSPADEVILKEKELLAVLDKVVKENHLSYTECCFDKLEGKDMVALRRKTQAEDK